MGLFARYLEEQGFPTTTLSISRGLTRRVLPPRPLLVTNPRGQTVGAAHDRTQQRQRVETALGLLHAVREGGTIVEEQPENEPSDS